MAKQGLNNFCHGDNTKNPAALIHNRQSADLLINHQARSTFDRGVRCCRDNPLGHNILYRDMAEQVF